MDPLVGQLVDERYRIESVLGEGGMGKVYLAEHLKLNKKVAFKVVRAEYAGNPELAVRFAREAMATSALDHPNVVRAIDYGTLPKHGAYLVMEFVKGKSLAEMLKQHGNMPWARVVELGAQIADALSAAHRRGIVHRDLKPENIIIQSREDGGDRVKILDFGVARLVRTGTTMRPGAQPSNVAGAVGLTQVGMVIGTPGYMAPEQALGQPASFSTDLYSLGIVLWEAIVGRQAFGGDDLRAIVKRQVTEDLPSVREETSDFTIPEDIDILIGRLCAVDEDERPKDAGSVRDLFKRMMTLAMAAAPPSQTELDLLGKTVDIAPIGASGLFAIEQMADAELEAALEAAGAGDSGAEGANSPRRAGPWALVALGILAAVAAAMLLVVFGQLEVRPQGELDETVQTLVDPAAAAARAPEAAGGSAVATQPPPNQPPPELVIADDPVDAGPEGVLDAGLGEDIRGYVEVLRDSELHGPRLAAAGALLALGEPAKPTKPTKKGRKRKRKRPVIVSEVKPPPRFALLLAELQLADGCESAEKHIDALIELAAPGSLQPLERVLASPEAVCGPARDLKKCSRCIKKRLAPAMPRLRVLAGTRARP
ncbi:MAG: serine/threonine protein kinase [Myxococcales bacterium]|nr:serine/threonine protein kinase [Myxococcales bacterium]